MSATDTRFASSRAGRLIVAFTASLMVAGSVAGQPAAKPQAKSCPASLPELFGQVAPAVVSITGLSINPYDADNRIGRAMGSGLVIDASGLILTNSHVVFGRQVLAVALDDGTSLPAKLIGADPIFDIAIVKIPAPTSGSLIVGRLGESARLVVGEEVYAIGNPLGLEQTLTRGVVSAINRALPGAAWSLTEPMIQTDAAINLGNSGGPLVDPCGQVVGIITATMTGAQSIGFAIPIDLVKQVVPQLIEKGRVVRPWLGVQGQFAVPEMKEMLRVSLPDGFLVEAVEPGSPAEQAGLHGGLFEITFQGQPILLGGDIITQVNGIDVNEPAKLDSTLDVLKVGSSLKLTVISEGKQRVVELKLAERPTLLWDMPARGAATVATGSLTSATPGGAVVRRRTIVF